MKGENDENAEESLIITNEEDKNKKNIDANEQNNLKENSNKNNKNTNEQNTENEKINIQSREDFWYGISLFGRILFTLYSIHGVFFIYNFVIQYIIMFPSILYSNEMSKVAGFFFSCIYALFAINTSNLLLIPTYEFFSFPFLLYKQPFAHIISFVYTHREVPFTFEDIDEHNIFTKVIFSFFIVLEIVYIVGLACVYFFELVIIKDCIKMGILIIIYVYYTIIFLSYFVYSFYLFFVIICPSFCSKKGRFRNILTDYFKNKEISNLNLYSNIINPILSKNYIDRDGNEKKEEEHNCSDCNFEYNCYEIISYLKLVTLVLSIICLIFLFAQRKNDWYDYLSFTFLYIMMSVTSLTINFPFCYRNRSTFGVCGCHGENNFVYSNYKFKDTKKLRNSKVVSFTRCISNFVILGVGVGLPFIFILNIQTGTKNYDFFTGIQPKIKPIYNDTKKLLLPNVCYSSVHGIPLSNYLPFINDAYYYDNIVSNSSQVKVRSSLEIKEYFDLFFDEDYEIDIIGNLTDKTKNGVTMIQYNVRNKKEYVTILSIKGTSLSKDFYIDAQLYVSSIFLSILSAFSLTSTQKDSWSFNLIEYSLNIPYRIFLRFLIIDTYMNDLKKAYIDNEYTFYQNVVIVGHSLGGGLAKLFGRFIGKQAISLSGPGVNAFHSLWKYKQESENFEISAIDFVPDMDLVPRVEVSGGTIYKIVCKKGVFSCHGKELSLCETLTMCRSPIYLDYCEKIAKLNNKEITKIEESSNLN